MLKIYTTSDSLSNIVTLCPSRRKEDQRTAKNKVSCFKTDHHFFGKVEKNVSKFIANYIEAAINYKVSTTQKQCNHYL